MTTEPGPGRGRGADRERGDAPPGGAAPAAAGGTPRIFTPEYYRRMDALEAHGWWNAGMRDVAAVLLDRVGLPGEGTLVDVGCGTGRTLEWFGARRPGWRRVGADVAPEGLTLARGEGRSGDGLVRADARALPLAGGIADLVICLDVLQHLPLDGGDAAALEEMRRVATPGAHVLLRTNAQAFPRREDDPENDFHRYEPDELRGRLEAAGFDVLRLSRINAVLGLAEIPRELRSVWKQKEKGYQGILADAGPDSSPLDRLKRAWLRLEGRLVAAGGRLPAGRSIVALTRRPA